MQAKLDFASQENIAIRTSKAEIAKRLERSEGELAAAREQNGVLSSIEEQLQTRCNTLQSDLQELRCNPRIPVDYKEQVEATHEAQLDEIADLESEVSRQKMAVRDMENSNANAQDEIESLQRQLEQAQYKIEETDAMARAAAKNTNEARRQTEELSRENNRLSSELRRHPTTITENRTVYVRSPPRASRGGNGALTDADLLAIFDAIDADATGFAGRLELRDRVVETNSSDSIVFDLVEQLKRLDVIVVERDDFKVMLAKLRGVLEADEVMPEEEARGAISGGELLALFDALDEDSTGFVSKGDLLGRLEREQGVHSVMDGVEGMDAAIVNREDFEDIIMGGPSKRGTSAGASSGQGNLSIADLMDIFDQVDPDGVGFAQRLDLKNRIEESAGMDRLIDELQGLSTVIVERADFQSMCNQFA